jgi:hypothetical protein
MTPIEQFFYDIEHTALSQWVVGESMLAFPAILSVHTVGMGLVAGFGVVIGLRLLGYAPGVPVAALEKFYPVFWAAFAANAASGVLLLAGYPYKAFTNPDFYIKLTLIGIGVYLTVKVRRDILLSPDANTAAASVSARRLALLLMAAWFGAILSGRLLAYTFKWLRVGIPGGF